MKTAADSAGPLASGILMLHLLGRCNLRCVHCYMEGSPSRREELSVAAVLGAISECKQLGVTDLYLTGGEPLLYRRLDDVLRASAQISRLRVTVCTNGMLVTARHAAFFRDLGVKASVSIDGDETFHDRFRGQSGAFRKAERGVRALVQAGVTVAIVTTITQGNLYSLPYTVHRAAEVGAESVFVLPMLKLGRGLGIADQCLTDVQMNRMLIELSDLGNKYRTRGLACRLNGVATRRFLMAHPCGAYVCNGSGCHRRVAKELKKMIVREDGTVLPEMTNLSPEFAMGNIHDSPLTKLVEVYLETGYSRFDELCRTTYAEVLPTWNSTIVPWDEIVAARSHNWVSRPHKEILNPGCGTCLPME